MRSCADNAMVAKVHALYGGRLRGSDYEKLLQSKSVADVAAYLKNETGYSAILGEVKEELIHRGQLESLVRRRNLNSCMSLLHYSYDDKFFFELYVRENEIRQLLLALRLLNANSMDRYIVALPVYLSRHMSFDLFAVADARSYDDLLAIVSHSSYHAILSRFRPVSADRHVDITACERALEEAYYKTALARVDKYYTGSTQTALRQLLHSKIDYHNLMVAVRLKRYFHFPAQRVRESMVQIKTELSPALAFDEILNARDEHEVADAIHNAYLSRKFKLSADSALSDLSVRLNLSEKNLYHRLFRFSTKPVIVVLSYMFMLEIEVGNIVNIIEGIRYQLPPEEIRSLLIV